MVKVVYMLYAGSKGTVGENTGTARTEQVAPRSRRRVWRQRGQHLQQEDLYRSAAPRPDLRKTPFQINLIFICKFCCGWFLFIFINFPLIFVWFANETLTKMINGFLYLQVTSVWALKCKIFPWLLIIHVFHCSTVFCFYLIFPPKIQHRALYFEVRGLKTHPVTWRFGRVGFQNDLVDDGLTVLFCKLLRRISALAWPKGRNKRLGSYRIWS